MRAAWCLFLLFDGRLLMFDVCSSLHAVCYVMYDVRCSVLVCGCLLFDDCCLLCLVCYSQLLFVL